MKIRKWSEDNRYYTKEETIDSVRKNFDIRRFQSAEGFTVQIEEQDVDIIVSDYTNPLNQNREDWKILVPTDFNVKRGHYVQWKNDIYLIVTKVRDREAYFETRMVATNYNLKWVDLSGKIAEKRVFIEKPVNSRIEDVEYKQNLTLVNGEYVIVAPTDDDVRNLKRDMRFIIDGRAFEIIGVTNIPNEGLTFINIDATEKIPTDDLDNGIANADKIIPDEEEEQPLEDYNVTINGKDIVYTNREYTYEAVVKDGENIIEEDVVWVFNSPYATVTNEDGNSITIKIANHYSIIGNVLLIQAYIEKDGTIIDATKEITISSIL